MTDSDNCIICGAPGTLFFEGLNDVSCGGKDLFDIKRCRACGLLWLVPPSSLKDPAPRRKYHDLEVAAAIEPKRSLPGLKDAIRRAILCGRYGYRDTHKSHIFCALGGLLGRIPVLRSKAVHGLGRILPPRDPDPEALFVDIGCGNGNLLRIMSELGWKVFGIEPDEAGAKAAGDKGIPVFNGLLKDAKLPDSSAAHIRMVHALEHIPDPEETLKECYRILKPGGTIAIRMPNAGSLSLKVFGKHCYLLDVPRHLFIYSPDSARRLFEKFPFKEFHITTSANASTFIYSASAIISARKKIDKNHISRQRGRAWFSLREKIGCYLGKEWGEEIEIYAVK